MDLDLPTEGEQADMLKFMEDEPLYSWSKPLTPPPEAGAAADVDPDADGATAAVPQTSRPISKVGSLQSLSGLLDEWVAAPMEEVEVAAPMA